MCIFPVSSRPEPRRTVGSVAVVRAETTLEKCTYFTLKVDVEQSQERVEQKESYSDCHTFHCHCCPRGEAERIQEEVMNPVGDN